MTDQQQGAKPGWYPDGAGNYRWWDGSGWTELHMAAGGTAPVVNQTVTVQADRKRVNHLLHLVLTIVTFGLWLPVWIIIALAKS